MLRLLCLTATLAALVVSASAAPPGKFTFVDLGAYTNQKRSDNFGSGRDGNDLKAVGKDGRTFAGVNFKIGEGVIQLGSKLQEDEKPRKVNGIKVGQTAIKIHILQATGYGRGMPGSELFVEDGTAIGEYKVRYADGTNAIIPIVYGQDVRDWWFREGDKSVTRGKVAWQGENELSKSFEQGLRLYLTSWENPHPAKKITTMDYVKIGDGPAAPFCVAITLEAK